MTKRLVAHCGIFVEKPEHFLKMSTAVLDDGNINNCDEVFRKSIWDKHPRLFDSPVMSLNKKKRWLLPDQISEVIDGIISGGIPAPTVDEVSCRITMVERRLMPTNPLNRANFYQNLARGGWRRRDCVSYHDSGMPMKHHHVKPTQPYSYYSHLLLKAAGKSTVKVKPTYVVLTGPKGGRIERPMERAKLKAERLRVTRRERVERNRLHVRGVPRHREQQVWPPPDKYI